MAKDDFTMPDMGDLGRLMKDAMADAEEAMEGLSDVEGLPEGMAGLSGLLEGLSGQMAGLGGAMTGFAEAHEENAASLAGEPDWSVVADIEVAGGLKVRVSAEFDQAGLVSRLESTQGEGFEALVAGVAADSGEEFDDATMGQIMEQLGKGRSVALVRDIEVVECSMPGAPSGAVDELRLSPEANIPMSADDAGLHFEFAPMLTIRNDWENADLPTFEPFGEAIAVPAADFEAGKPFERSFTVKDHKPAIKLTLTFAPLG